MDEWHKPRALIIGGSLGGLFTALCLRTVGWRVDVFERSAHALDSRGGESSCSQMSCMRCILPEFAIPERSV
jgi:2-polyprenyl-6-methoxyphenol hydroxylase-like FAD-dependent oxidoreductase